MLAVRPVFNKRKLIRIPIKSESKSRRGTRAPFEEFPAKRAAALQTRRFYQICWDSQRGDAANIIKLIFWKRLLRHLTVQKTLQNVRSNIR